MFLTTLFLGGCSWFGVGVQDVAGSDTSGDSVVPPDPGGDTGPVDTSPIDTSAPDTATLDTDTGAPDTDVVDTAAVDTDPIDTDPVDTAAPVLTEADELFEEGTIHDFTLTLDEAAIASLTADPSIDVPAWFSFGATDLYVAVHIKGSHSLRGLDEKAAFKIDFNDLVPGQRFLGLEHLTLNNMVQDRSMLREHTAYWLYEQLGVPGARHGYARVEVNGNLFGLYGIVESMDNNFLARRFAGDTGGNLYETRSARGDVTSDRYRYFDLKQAGTVPAGEDLAELARTFEAASSANFLEMLDSAFSADDLLSFLALDIVMGHNDGYVTSCNNFLIYNAPVAGKWHLLPWGQDQTFDEESSIYLDYEGQITTRCIQSPSCKAAFDARLREVADLWESAELAAYVEEVAAVIGADCAADPRKEHECSSASLLDFIATRPDAVRAQLP